MLLVEMLLDKLLCWLKMLGCLRGNTTGSWSSGVEKRSRDDEEDVDDTDDVEDVAGYKHQSEQLGLTTPAVNLNDMFIRANRNFLSVHLVWIWLCPL